MTLDLSVVEFKNDFFRIDLPKGGQLVLNCIDESVSMTNTPPLVVSRINMQIWYRTSQNSYYTSCSSIIGLSDEITKITTDHPEYEGSLLTKDNMQFCKVEVYEG